MIDNSRSDEPNSTQFRNYKPVKISMMFCDRFEFAGRHVKDRFPSSEAKGTHGRTRKETGSQPEAKGASRNAVRYLRRSAGFAPRFREV
jgi:hypothetical protein